MDDEVRCVASHIGDFQPEVIGTIDDGNVFPTVTLAALAAPGRTDIGAIVTFTGTVRGEAKGRTIVSMTLEHYPGMTEKALEEIVADASRRFKLLAVRVIHRFGRLEPGDQIVFVGVASAHRGEAFAACEFIMDFLKTNTPFWKKEETPDGSRWVDARDSDNSAASRWDDIEMLR